MVDIAVLLRAIASFSKGAKLTVYYENEQRQETRIYRGACYHARIRSEDGTGLFGSMGDHYERVMLNLAMEMLKHYPEHSALIELRNHLGV